MSKQILLLAGAALLFAGTVQADAAEARAAQERSTIVQQEAPAPSASSTAVADSAAKVAEQKLHPDAKPVYLSGADCGSN